MLTRNYTKTVIPYYLAVFLHIKATKNGHVMCYSCMHSVDTVFVKIFICLHL